MSVHRDNFFSTVCSYLFGRTVESLRGEINPMLEVVHMNGRYILNSENANYSWGTLKDVFAEAFRELRVNERNINDVLILGYGTGSVASILLEDYKKDCSVTGVEKDKVVIGLAYKYYEVNQKESVKIIHDDAVNFLRENENQYDLVIVDVYMDLRVPAQCETEEFLKNLRSSLKENALVVFNKMYFDKATENSAHNLYERFGNVMGNASYLKVHRHHTNLMIYNDGNRKN